MEKDKEAFALEYRELCKKHGLYLQNSYCCCGSSSIAEIPLPAPEDEYSYEWDKYNEQINDIQRQLKAQK